jgi:putative ABC transport system ATP-binding protein
VHDPSTIIFNIQIEPALFKYTWSYSKYQQLTLLLITFITFPFIFYSLNLSKIIINKAIAGKDFPKELFGHNLEQIEYLLILYIVF